MYRINNTIRLNRGGQSTKSLRKLNNKSVLLALALSSAVISMAFLSCSNLAGGASDNAGGGTPADSQIILCTGNISTGGGFSENVAGILSSAVAPTSSATSSGAAGSDSGSLISSAAPTVQNTYTYFAEATYEGLATPVTGSFNNETNPTEFGIALAAGKSWTITCGIKNAAGDIVLSDSYPDFTPTAANPVISRTFNLAYNSSGTGSISLVMSADSVISRVTASCHADAWQDANGAITYANFSGGSATLSVPSIAAGTYDVVLKFYSIDNPSGTGALLRYETEQSITVVDGMVTSTWRSDGTGVINAEGVFNVSSSIINAARRYTFYVGSREGVTGSNGNEGYSSRPFATITQACKYIAANADSNGIYKIYINGTASGSHEGLSMVSGKASSITIEGFNSTPDGEEPSDTLDGGFTTATDGGTVLKIASSAVPVTVKNLKITGGFTSFSSAAGGINCFGDLTLENCVISGNKSPDEGSGIYLGSSGSLTLKGKNKITGNTLSDGTTASNLSLPYGKTITVAGNIAGSQIGINMGFTDTNKPTASAPVLFTSGYGYGTKNSALPGTIFTAENGYAITRITGGTNAGEAAFAVSSGSMYTALDYDFSFTTSAVTAVVNTAKNVAVPVTVNRRESDGNEPELSLADIADDITWNAALYNGTVAVDSNLNVTNTSTGINIAIPAAVIAYEGTYLLKITATYMGLAHDAEFTVSVNPPYTFSTEPAEIPAGTTGTGGTSATYVYFGDWPQTIKASGVEIDETSTKVQGAFTYYLGSDGNYYAKCKENAYETGYTYSDGTTSVAQSDANSYKYFKVEPIKWRVLTDDYNYTGKKLLLAENALTASVPYYDVVSNRTIGGATVYPNNYKESAVRAYLNGLSYTNGNGTSTSSAYSSKGFLQTAFTSDAQLKIATTTVINDGDSTTDANGTVTKADGTDPSYPTNYTCANTTDKVFLLSEQEVTTNEYGFTESSSLLKEASDFAKANHAVMASGYITWWLRSPTTTSNNAQVVRWNGSSNWPYYVNTTDYVIVPAIVLEN